MGAKWTRDQETLQDPQRGEVWEHVDGGSYYVRSRSGPLVRVQRRPFSDSQAMPKWIRVRTFSKYATGRLR